MIEPRFTMLRAIPDGHPAIEDPWEHMIYWTHVRAAERGERAMTVADMSALLSCSEGGTMTGIEQRMENRGWIKVERFQRWRKVTIMATGKSTKEPPKAAPHWRNRPEHGCEPVALLRLNHPEAFQEMMVHARRERRSLAAYLADFLAESWERRLDDA